MSVQPMVPVQLMLTKLQFGAIEKRAATMGKRPADYCRLIWDAAFAARIAQERQQGSGDAELDRAVQGVFLLAGCEPADIAGALGVSQATVEKIISGWRQVTREGLPSKTMAPVPAREPENVAPRQAPGRRVKSWTDEDRALLTERWAAGDAVPAIAEALGRPFKAVEQYIHTHRSLCPKRRDAR